MIDNKYYIKLLLLIIGTSIVLFLSLNLGSEIKINIFNINTEQDFYIIFNYRLPRVILAFLIGISLSIAGMTLQSLFSNPLVDPFVIGVSGGGALGAGIAILLGINFLFLGISSISIFALLGSFVVIILVYKLGSDNNTIYIDRLLLAGIAISSLCSAILSLLLVIKGKDLETVIYWILGSLNNKSWEEIFIFLPFFIIGIIIVIFNLKNLNVLQTGEDIAISLGIETNRLKFFLILASALLTSAAVCVSGVIGFIGLVVPHLSRLFLKNYDLKYLLPFTLLIGGNLLVLSDTLARTLLAPQQVPVGIFTAILGVPFFISLLYKKS